MEISKEMKTSHSKTSFQIGQDAYEREDYSEALKIWLKASKSEDAEAQYYVALCYYDLIHNETDENQEIGFEYLFRAAENGLSDAQHALGVFYQGGDPKIIVPAPDDELSRKWLVRAAESGSTRAMIELGILGIEQKDENITLEDAEKYLKQAHSLGEPKAANALGILYERNNDYENAAQYFRLSRSHGYSMANVNLAKLYVEGLGVEKNASTAVDLVLESANETAHGEIRYPDAYYAAFDLLEKLAATPYDEPRAQNALGERAIRSAKYSLLKIQTGAVAPVIEETYLWDDIHPIEVLVNERQATDHWLATGIQEEFKRSIDEAYDCFAKASNQGNIESCFNIGVMIQLNLIPQSSYDAAIKYFKTAAAKGHIQAQLQLAILEDTRNPNSKEAFEYFLACAQLDLPIAQYETGRRYDFGHGVSQDFKEAAYWYKHAIICSQATDKANILASYNIGLMYKEGNGVPCSLEEAYMRVNFALRMSELCGSLRDDITEKIRITANHLSGLFSAEQLEQLHNTKKNYREFPD